MKNGINFNLDSTTSSPIKINKRSSTKTNNYFKKASNEIPLSLQKMSINNLKLIHQPKVKHTEISDAKNEEDKLLAIHGNSLKLFYVSLSYKFDTEGNLMLNRPNLNDHYVFTD